LDAGVPSPSIEHVHVRLHNAPFDGAAYSADSGSGPVPLIGTMRDNQLAMTVSWSSGGAGRYTATMNPDGLLTDGFTQNLSMHASTASWSTAEQFKCEVRSR
jgi:hypothetical protein